jgi:hypothetical protein
MLTAIKFNDEFLARSAEVNDIIPDGMLIPKMNISHTMGS